MLTLQANLGGYCGRCCRPSSTSSCLRIAATSGPCRGPCWGWSSSMRSTLASYGRAWWAASLLTSRPPCPSGLTLSWTALNATCSPRTGTGESYFEFCLLLWEQKLSCPLWPTSVTIRSLCQLWTIAKLIGTGAQFSSHLFSMKASKPNKQISCSGNFSSAFLNSSFLPVHKYCPATCSK